MATELDRLFVTLEADLSNYQAGLKRAGADLGTFTREAETKTTQASRAISAGMKGAEDSTRRTANQMQNLSFQANDAITMLASGSSVFQVLATQGGQVYQALGQNGGVAAGLRNVRDSLLGAITPTRLLGAGLVATGAAAVLAGVQFSTAEDRISTALKGIGSASGATVKDVDRIAASLNATRNIGVGAARDIATSLVATGKIGVDNIEGIAGLAPGFAKITGTDLEEAGQRLGKLFSDPVKGAREFMSVLGGVNAATLRMIENLAAAGERQQAIVRLREAVAPKIEAAVTPRSVIGQIYDYGANLASSAYNSAGQAVSGAFNEKPLVQRRDEARARFEAARTRSEAAGTRYPRELEADFLSLERQVERFGKAKAEAFNADEVAELSNQLQPLFDKMDPDGELLRGLQNNLELTGNTIAKVFSTPTSNEENQRLGEYIARYGALQKAVEAVSAARAKGGVAAQQAAEAADLTRQTASLSNYERGLRQIVFQFEQLAKQQELVGNTAAAQGFRNAGAGAVAAYSAQNVERARGEISVPGDYYSFIRAAESSGNDRAVSSTGATGRYQFIKGTWLELFRDVKSSRFAEIQKANTGADGSVNQRAVEAAVLALRNDPELQEELVRAFTTRNAAALDREGFAPTARNLYAAHNIGAGGAAALLRAEREGRGDATAQSVLDRVNPNLTSANRGYYGDGKTVSESLAILERKTQANSASARSAREDVAASDAQTQALGKSAVEAARLKSANDDLRAARERGDEVGRLFANGEELLRKGSAGLTGELKAQTDQLIANADARGRAANTALSTRFQQDQQEARAALGRTYEEQAAYQGARSYGATPGSDEFTRYYEGLREIQTLTEAKNATGSFLKDLNYDLMRGASLSEALGNALSRLSTRLADKALDGLVSGLFGGGGIGSFLALGGGGGGSPTGGVRLFSGGGFTGPGGKYTPAGVVHAGEYVFDQAAVQRIGVPTLEALRRNLKGFAEGGFVGAMSAIPSAVPARSGSNVSVRGGDVIISAPGADRAGLMELKAYVDAGLRESRRTIGQQLANWRENSP